MSNLSDSLRLISNTPGCALYQIQSVADSNVTCFVASTPESRSICNDPTVMGVTYTNLLRSAVASTLKTFAMTSACTLEEKETVVLHILRGGLNFGIREAIADAFSWNSHVSAFLSAQRRRQQGDEELWEIVEREYRKVYLPENASIVFGDVVATGTSLRYALQQLQTECSQSTRQLRSIVFFTIGGSPSETAIESFDAWARATYPNYQGSSVIYFEGRFGVATPESTLQIKLTGTDLIREGAVMAPEFVQAQAQAPQYPLERCAIYDAGSRAFCVPEYLEDVREYWLAVLALAQNGLSYEQYLEERYPQAPEFLSRNWNLQEIARRQLEKLTDSNS